jgi:hypothetical protein
MHAFFSLHILLLHAPIILFGPAAALLLNSIAAAAAAAAGGREGRCNFDSGGGGSNTWKIRLFFATVFATHQ